MQSYFRQMTTGITLVALLTGTTAASAAVYETVDLFKGKTFFTDSFDVDTAGNYQATLTDFEFPRAMKRMALHVTSSTDSLGSIFAPGSFDFEADAGTYYVSFLARAGQGNKRDKGTGHRKDDDRNGDRRQKHRPRHRDGEDHHGMAGNGQRERREKRDHHDHDWTHGRGMMGMGQYGIEIAYLDDSGTGMPPGYPGNGNAAVPIPAAVWLFGSGLLGITGLGIRRKARV